MSDETIQRLRRELERDGLEVPDVLLEPGEKIQLHCTGCSKKIGTLRLAPDMKRGEARFERVFCSRRCDDQWHELP